MVAAAQLRARRVGPFLLALALATSEARAAADEPPVQTLSDDASPADRPGAGEQAAPLALETVLVSAREHFPLLLAAELERDVRRGELQSARGGFDTRLRVEGDLRPAGFYENYGADAVVEQPTRLWGASLFGGYRYGDGDFPSYDGRRLTDEAGEVRAGLGLPLARGGPIDPARARIRRSEIAARRVGPEIDLQRIDVQRDAAVAYWNWVSAGLRVQIAERLLGVAVERQEQIEGRVRSGAQPEIDLVDNERLIVDRRVRLRAAVRDFEQASIALSLYLREEDGAPRRAGRAALPSGFPSEDPPDPERLESDVAYARASHPRLRELALERERLEVDAGLARNDMLPRVDLSVEGSQDFGDPSPGIDTVGKLSAEPRSETEVKALLRFELPVQRRQAKGRLAVARARIAQLDQRMRFAGDRIVAEILRAVEGLEAAFDQTGEARRNLALARRLQRAEQRRLALGLGNLIDVNIRELQAASAEEVLVDAQAGYFRALADYEAAVTRGR